MEYRFIRGYRAGSILLHVISENRLYVQKVERNGCKEYICYQTILAAPKKKGNGNHQNCTARVRIHPDGRLERMSLQHTRHDDHKKIILDCEQFNNMKQDCETLRDKFPEDAHKVSTKNIFVRELAK